MASQPPSPAAEYLHRPGSFDFRALLHTLVDKFWVILLCIVVTGFLTGAYIMSSPKQYLARAVVQVEQQEQKILKGVEKVQQEDLRSLDVLRTIEQVFKSQSLFERVVTNYLATDPRFAQMISDPQCLNMLANGIDMKLRRGTRLIDITVIHTNAPITERTAYYLIKEFLRMNYEQDTQTTEVANDFLILEATRLKRELEEWENKLQAYKEKTQSVSVEDRQNIVMQQLKDVSLRVTEAKSKRVTLESEYAQVQKLGTNARALLVISAVANDPSVKQIQASITKLEAEFANLKQRYKEKHPKYMQAASELANWQNSLQEAILAVPKVIFASLESARASEQALERKLHEQESLALDLSKQQIQYNVIAREVESHKTLYETVMGRRNETALTKKLPSEDNKIRVVQPAVVPQRPFKPEPAKLMIRGLLAGLVAGILLALGLNALDSSFKTVDQTEEFLAMPVLSVVPQIRDLKPESRTLVVSEDAKSAGAEAFRSLRTALSMLGREEDRRTFLFSSALPQEGKTFCSLNYAASLAQQGLRTVLIDGDLRRPAVEPALTGNSQRGVGVTDYLTGQKKFQEIVQRTSLENFSFVSAGTTAPNPAELLAQRGIDALIEEALSHYDRVLVDSAPIHAVSDTLPMVNRIQTVCLVVRAYKTPRKAVLRAIQLLQKSRAPIAGIILNRVPRKRGLEYYYDPYYDYAYHGKYAQKGVYGA